MKRRKASKDGYRDPVNIRLKAVMTRATNKYGASNTPKTKQGHVPRPVTLAPVKVKEID